MKKKSGPDLGKWKDYRYNLIKEDVYSDYEIVDNSAQEDEIENLKTDFIKNVFPKIDEWAEKVENLRDSADDSSWYSGLIKFIGELYNSIKKYHLHEMPKYEIPEEVVKYKHAGDYISSRDLYDKIQELGAFNRDFPVEVQEDGQKVGGIVGFDIKNNKFIIEIATPKDI